MCVVLKEYTVLYDVDIVENILNLTVTREHWKHSQTKLYGTWSTINIWLHNTIRTWVLPRAKGMLELIVPPR